MSAGTAAAMLKLQPGIAFSPFEEATGSMGDSPEAADEELMWRAQRGRPEAFDELVERHHRRVFGWAYRFAGRVETAEEWTQEVFLRVFEHRDSYDPRRPFVPWLRRVTVNCCLNAREAEREAPLSLETAQEGGQVWEYADTQLLPEQELEREETRRQVREALRRLPAGYRAVLLLRYFDELSYQEIAEALDMPLGTVKTHIHRAKVALRQELLSGAEEDAGWHLS